MVSSACCGASEHRFGYLFRRAMAVHSVRMVFLCGRFSRGYPCDMLSELGVPSSD